MNKEVEKTIYFYSIMFNPGIDSKLSTSFTGNEYSYIFESAFSSDSNGYYPFEFEKDKYAFDIIDFDKEYIFGTYSKEADLNKLLIYRDEKSHNTIPFSTPKGYSLELFTWFYADFSKHILLVINNRSLPNIDRILEAYFYKTEFENVIILPIKIDNAKEYLKKMKKMLKVKFQYASKTLKQEYMPLSHEKFDMIIDDYTVTAKISHTGTKTCDKLGNINKSDFSMLKIYTEDMNNITQSIDLISNIITKKVTFKLNESDLVDSEKVKEVLKSNINYYQM